MHQPDPSRPMCRYNLARWHLDIDRYINPFLPAPPWRWIPRPISHWFGYRERPVRIMGNVLIACWSLVGVFCGVALVAVVSMHIPSFQAHGTPIIIASFGAAAVLQFSAIESPLGQPRNAILGQLIAAVIGAGIGKLFDLSPSAKALPELGGALACGLTTAVMVLTNTVHPPAGATALLAVTNSPHLGWYLIPVMMLGCGIMLVVALIINNIQRRYPTYWWTAHELGKKEKPADPESAGHKQGEDPSQYEESLTDEPPHIFIRRGETFVSEGIVLDKEERELLEKISSRI